MAAVLGGGLAGMSAAVSLASEGYRVALFEKRSSLGGRAGSHPLAGSGDWVDNCQHVLMPCCTNLLDFYSRLGVADRIRFYSEIPFIDGRGRVSRLRGSPLPAPLHCAPSFAALGFLGARDKLRIARGLLGLLALGGRAPDGGARALDWFRGHGQSETSVRDFWELVLVSALNDTLDRASFRYAAKVFLDAFLHNARGWWLGVPAVPLGDLYGEPVVRFLTARGCEVRLRSEALGLARAGGRVAAVELAGGARVEADVFVVALPWGPAADLLREPLPALAADLDGRFEPSPITGVHLWFDRAVTDLHFAALPGRQIQWFFNKSRNFAAPCGGGSYLQLVTSASRRWMHLGKKEILDIALGELSGALPVVREARILRAHVLKEPHATFSPSPECEPARPAAATAIPNLYLAGDWIATGWPATMEGAVRGGYLAAEAVLAGAGRPKRLIAPDLPPSGLMRLFRP